MDFVFFGTPEFAAIILEKLIKAGLVPRAVVANPDRPVGRKQILTAPPTKEMIRGKGLEGSVKIFQPENFSPLTPHLSPLKPDIFIVAAYTKILPKEILAIPRLGTIGVHPSLLPKYRGPTPIQTAILKGEEETGVTLYLVDEKVDHGKIISNIKYQISKTHTYESLAKKLAELGGDLLIETLPKFIKGEIKPIPQNENEATYTKKFTAEDGFIEPEILRQAEDGVNLKATIDIERQIRALNPEPGVWTIKNGKRMKLLEAEIIDNKLLLKTIQLEGKKPTAAI